MGSGIEKRKGGVWYWRAKNVNRKHEGYEPQSVRLHGDEAERLETANRLTQQFLTWLSFGDKAPWNGTVDELIDLYRKTPESPYHRVKPKTRLSYDESLNILSKAVGSRHLKRLTGLDFQRWYERLREPKAPDGPPRVRRAHAAMTVFRIAVSFGVVAGKNECVPLLTILSAMRFPNTRPRSQFITFDQVKALCEKAIETGHPSIALAQAFQFELTLRQIDVIGEWEDTPDGKRWTNGLRWSDIDREGVLRKVTTKTGAVAVHDTKASPFLRSMIDLVPPDRRIGPVIVREETGRPWIRDAYAKQWRKLARDVGIPDEVWNRDSRAGGITEGSDAGADIEHLRHHATHANVSTTVRYNRQTADKTRAVAELRAVYREKK